MQEQKEISWRAHPVVDDFPRSLAAIAIIIFCSVLFYLVSGLIWFGLFAFIIFFLSMLAYFLPIGYRITGEFLSITFLGFENKYPLGKYRNFYVNPSGIHFSTFSHPSPLDPFRGNFVRFNRNKDEVLGFLKEVLPPEVIANSQNISSERKDYFSFLDTLFKRKSKK